MSKFSVYRISIISYNINDNAAFSECVFYHIYGRNTMTKLMLIRPKTPDTSRSGLVSIQYPINIGYLVSYLEKFNISSIVRDYEVEPFNEIELVETVKSNNISIIGFSCMTPHITHAALMAKCIKERFPHILTVVGGVHATAIPDRTLTEFPQFDAVVMGEGEETLLELYRTWTALKNMDAIQGISYRKGTKIKSNPSRPLIGDLDQIPPPDRKMFDMALYKKSHVTRGISRKVVNIAEIITSRGCPYSCIFCASKIIHGRQVRFRSKENIIAEMEMLIGDLQIDHFSFLDDTFTLKPDILKAVCKFMKAKNVTFDCLTRVSDIDEEKMRIMVTSGCRKISFGIESGSPRILKLLRKGITLEQAQNAFYLARRFRLPIIEASFMIGSHPDETIEDIVMTKKFIYKLRPDILAAFIAIPYPGTELNHILKERGLLNEERWEDFKLFFGDPSWQLSGIPMKKLQKILKGIIYAYYFNPSYILTAIGKIRSYKEFKYWAELGLSFIKSAASRPVPGK